MNRLRTIMLCLVAGVASCYAQMQQGYVKTLGRPGQKGVALSGVTVRVKGAHNAVVSKSDGTFSMTIQSNSYVLQQVRKEGYELREPDVVGRLYAYSAKVPLTIVMASSAQLQADRQRIENKAYEMAERNFKTRLAQLEVQQRTQQLTIDDYRRQLQVLQKGFENYQSLIDALADHYARTDYDALDQQEREINQCIEKGELERAEQLLQQLDIPQRIAAINQRLQAGKALMDEASEDMEGILRQQEKDAEYLYQLYTIAMARFDNEKARFYIETRAALDTTNVRWQIDAGEFAFENLNKFNDAQAYFLRGMRHAAPESLEKAECLNDMAMVNLVRGNFSMAHQLLQESLRLRQQLVPEESPQMATIYNSLAVTFLAQGKPDEALPYHRRSLDIRRAVYGTFSAKVAHTYYNIGAVLISKKDFDGAKECFSKGLEIADKLNGNIPVSLQLKLYDGMGGALAGKADAEGKPYSLQVREYREKALDLCLRIYGEKNINTAGVYHNIGSVYIYNDLLQVLSSDTVMVVDMKDAEKGLEYLVKSIEIKKALAPQNLRPINETEGLVRLLAKNYLILSYRNRLNGDDRRAQEYFQRASEIFAILGETVEE